MSSSYLDGYPGRGEMSSPAPASTVSQTTNDPSIRLMRLKVLYTFDEQSQTNCLARWHASLPIHTAFLDEKTQIGVVELKICLQAVVSASPELIGKLGHDFTVYAFDYSEYETPLVGQGMLSWMLSSAVPTEPAHRSRKMVTGRVSRNVLGLFAGSSEETLEVKLRLVPVPHCLQSEYIQNMNKYHDISKKLPPNFDPQAWSDLLKNNPSLMGLFQQSAPMHPSSNVGIEHVQRLMLPDFSRPSVERESSFEGYQGSSVSDLDQIRPSSSASNIRPAQAQSSSRPASRQSKTRRPSSRASNTSLKGRKRGRNVVEEEVSAEEQMVQEISEERQGDGTVKKRAKVVKAVVPKAGLVTRIDSLRVAASEAASVRVHQPTAVRPSANTVANLEEPPRVPTPIPRGPQQAKRGSLLKQRSSLGMEAMTLSDSSTYSSPYISSDTQLPQIESAATTPESDCAPSLPRSYVSEIASSPPSVMGAFECAIAPSSPILPLNQHEQAIFSTNNHIINSLFEDDTPDIDMQSPGTCDLESRAQPVAAAHSPSSQPPFVNGQLPPAPPQKADLQTGPPKQSPQSGEEENTKAKGGPRATLNRASTWSAAPPNSEADAVDGEEEKQKRKYAPWNKQARKAAIALKLENSIKNGVMPPFCCNCGAIETPTWRKIWEKEVNGHPDENWINDPENCVHSWHVLARDAEDVVTRYKLVKKRFTKKDEMSPDGYRSVLICNPCGIWYNKYKNHRPEEQWYNVKGGGRSKARGKYTGEYTKKQKEMANKHAEIITNMGPGNNDHGSGASSPAIAPSVDGDLFSPDETGLFEEPDLPRQRPRASSEAVPRLTKSQSEGLPEHVALEALHRAMASSPGRRIGDKDSPIEINDSSPNPARRSLFPSPKGKSPTHSSGDPFLLAGSARTVHSSPLRNKTNPQAAIDQVEKQFGEDNSNAQSNPSTPLGQRTNALSPYKSSAQAPSAEPDFSQFLKTPTGKTPPTGRGVPGSEYFMSAARKFLEQEAPSPIRTPSKPPSHHHTASDPMPAALSSAVMSPFTRQLNAILSEANIAGTPSKTPSAHMNTYQSGFTNSFDFSDAPIPSSPPIRNMATGWFSTYELEPEGGWEAMIDEVDQMQEETADQNGTGAGDDDLLDGEGDEMDGVEATGGEEFDLDENDESEGSDELVIIEPQ